MTEFTDEGKTDVSSSFMITNLSNNCLPSISLIVEELENEKPLNNEFVLFVGYPNFSMKTRPDARNEKAPNKPLICKK